MTQPIAPPSESVVCSHDWHCVNWFQAEYVCKLCRCKGYECSECRGTGDIDNDDEDDEFWECDICDQCEGQGILDIDPNTCEASND